MKGTGENWWDLLKFDHESDVVFDYCISIGARLETLSLESSMGTAIAIYNSISMAYQDKVDNRILEPVDISKIEIGTKLLRRTNRVQYDIIEVESEHDMHVISKNLADYTLLTI